MREEKPEIRIQNQKARNSKIKTRRLHPHGTASIVAAPVNRGGVDVPVNTPVVGVPTTSRLVVTMLELEAVASPPLPPLPPLPALPVPPSLPLPLVLVDMTCTEVGMPEVEAPGFAVPELSDCEVGVVLPEVWLDDEMDVLLLLLLLEPVVVLALVVEVFPPVVEPGLVLELALLVVVEPTVWPAADVVLVPRLAQ
jgi:hypothetical protein